MPSYRKFAPVGRLQTLVLSGTEESPHRGAADAQLPCNGYVTEPDSREALHIRRSLGDTWRAAMPCAMPPGLRNAGFDPLAQHLPLKLRKDRQETSHGPPGRCGQI